MSQFTLDDYDRGIISERMRARRSHGSKPLIGDIVTRGDGMQTRIAHISGDTYQGTRWDPGAAGHGSFHLHSSGLMDFSGSLCGPEPLDRLLKDRAVAKVICWIFHHGEVGAHRGVDSWVYVNAWRVGSDSELHDKSKTPRYVTLKGSAELQTVTYTTRDGVERCAYCAGQSLEMYLLERPDCEVIDAAQFNARNDAANESRKTAPTPMTQERYFELLECLPPCRWKTRGGFEAFHVSERLTANLVQWCVKAGDSFYGFTDDAAISEESLVSKVRTYLDAR